MLWFSATSPNNDLLNHGVILKKCNETINWAFRSGFLRSIRAVLEGMTQWVWNPESEMTGKEVGRPDLLLENEDD